MTIKLHMDPIGLEMSGMTAEIMHLSKEFKITDVPLDSTHTDILYDQFKYIPVELLKLMPAKGK